MEEIAVLSHEQGYRYWQDRTTFVRGMLRVEQGQAAEGIEQMHQWLTNVQASGMEQERQFYLADLAEAYGKAGQPEEGLNAVAESFAVVDKHEKYFRNSAQYRLKGELILQQFHVSGSKLQVTDPQNLAPSVQAENEINNCHQEQRRLILFTHLLRRPPIRGGVGLL